MDCSPGWAAQDVEIFSPPQEKYGKSNEGKSPQDVLTEKHKDLVQEGSSPGRRVPGLKEKIQKHKDLVQEGVKRNKDTATSILLNLECIIAFAACIMQDWIDWINIDKILWMVSMVTSSLLMFTESENKFLCFLSRTLLIAVLLTSFISNIIIAQKIKGATSTIVFGYKKARIVIPADVLSRVSGTLSFVSVSFVVYISFLVHKIKSTYYPSIFRKSSTPRQYTKGMNFEAIIPKYLKSALHYLFALVSNQITVKHDDGGISHIQVYDAAEVYLRTKISPDNGLFKVGKTPKQKSLDISIEKGEEIIDRFNNNLELKGRFISTEPQNQNGYGNEKRFFDLSFNKRFRDRVLNEYLPFVLAKSKEIKDNVDNDSYGGGMSTESELGLVDSTTIISSTDFGGADNSAHLVREYQSGLTVSLSENKNQGEALKREFITKSILGLEGLQRNSGGRRDDGAKSFVAIYDPEIFAIHQQHFGKRCEGTAKSFRATHICRDRGISWVSTVKRIHKQHGVNQRPFHQKWETRKGYSLGEKRAYEVSSLSMDEKRVSKHMSQFPTSSPQPLALPNASDIVGPIAFSSNEFAAINNRAHLVRQNQSGSTASHYERKNTRETLTESFSSIEDLQQHFACKHKAAVKTLGVKVSIFKSSCRQHRVYRLPCQMIKNEQQAFDTTNNIAHLVKADQGILSVSYSEMENKREALKRECSGLSLENLPEHYGGRHEDAMKGLGDSLAWKSFEVLESLPLGEKSIIRHFAQQRTLTHKDCVQRKKSQELPRSLQMDCSGGLAAQGYSLGGEKPGEVLSLSMEEKLVSRFQFLHLTLQSGSEILGNIEISGHIALSSSEFTATNNGACPSRQDQGGSTNNGAHPGRQDQSGSSASRPGRERARETNNREGISREDLEKLFRYKREHAAKLLGFGLTKFKSICRKHGIDEWPYNRSYSGNSSPSIQQTIPPWPNWRSGQVLIPADPNGENNPSPTSNILSTNGQRMMEMEMGGPNSEPNGRLSNSFEDLNFQNIGNGSIAEFGLHTTFQDSHFCDADFHFPAVDNETEAAGVLGYLREQVSESSTFMSPVYFDPAAPSQPDPILHTVPHPQIASTPILRENMESFEAQRNLLAPQIEPFPEGCVFGSVNCTISSLPTIPHMTTLSTERPRFEKLDATCGEDRINLYLPLMPGIMELKQAVSMQLGLGLDSFKVKYKDGRGKWILMTHDEDVRELLQLTSLDLSRNQDSNRLDVIKVPNTTDFCGNCECDKCISLKGDKTIGMCSV